MFIRLRDQRMTQEHPGNEVDDTSFHWAVKTCNEQRDQYKSRNFKLALLVDKWLVSFIVSSICSLIRNLVSD